MLENRPTQVSLVVLGDPQDTNPLRLEWEVWEPSNRNWQMVVADKSCSPAASGLPAASIQARIPDALDSNRGQALLRVTRRIEQKGKLSTLVSNPVLVTVGVSL
jgi:hypothetical protein